jgi:heme A synthase
VILAAWITFADKRGRVKIIAWVGVACVAAEAILGRLGAPLSPGIGFLHALLSQILFALLVHIVVYEWPGWERQPEPVVDKGWPSLRGLSNSTVGALMLQVALGAAFRHNLLGVLWHILCAFVVVVFGLGMLVLITQVPENRSLRTPVIWLGSLLGVQVSLGMVLISISDPAKHALFSDISVASHVATGATCLGLGVLLSMLIRRAVIAAPAEVPAEG